MLQWRSDDRRISNQQERRLVTRIACDRLNIMAGNGVFVLLLLVYYSYPGGATGQCTIKHPPAPYAGVSLSSLGGLKSLASSANNTRSGMFSEDLPYESISEEFRKVYNGSSLNTNAFTGEWFKYSQNGIFLGGFIVFVGLLLPMVMFALWTFWECCYEEDEDEDEDNRYLTLTAQLVAWSLAAFLLVTLLCLFVFIVILLVGNSWVSSGVEQGSHAASTILPQLVELKDNTLSKVNDTVLGKFDSLEEKLNMETLDPVASSVTSEISNQYYGMIESLLTDVSLQLATQPQLLTEAHSLREQQLLLENSSQSQLLAIVASLQEALHSFKDQCEAILALNQSLVSVELSLLCEDFVASNEKYVPVVVIDFGCLGNKTEDGQLRLEKVVEVLSDRAFEQDAQPSDAKFNLFLDTLAGNLSAHITTVSDDYFSSIRSRLTQFVQNVTDDFNSTLHFGLPESQERLEEYLGPKYLENWEEFRSAFTVTFAIIVLLMMVCVGGAMAYGLLNVLSIYRYGEDMAYVEAAHQSGSMIKKLAFGFSAVCIVSALFFGFFISIVGVLGTTCGPYHDFSPIMTHVVDNPFTWQGEYPFGRALLDDPHYPLTVQSVIDQCRLNHSLYVAFSLEERGEEYVLEESIRVGEEQKDAYRDDMKSFSSIGDLTLLDADTMEQLQLLERSASCAVVWEDYTSLNSSRLYQESFVGVQELVDFIQEMRQAVDASPELETHHNTSLLLEAVEDALPPLVDYTTHFEDMLPSIHQSASYLEATLNEIATSQLLARTTDLESDVTVKALTETNTQLTESALDVNEDLSMYEVSTRDSLRCDTGHCHALTLTYDDFASAVCGDMVPGMDVYWTSLIVIFVISLLINLLALFLASRFIDLELEKANRSPKFHLSDAIIRQLRATFWLLLSISINIWFVAAVSRDDYFHEEYCRGASSGCCASCVVGFGIVLIILSCVVGVMFRVYQCVIIYRIKRCSAMEVRGPKVRRFWADRKKAVQFYSQLVQLFIQDVPFLILAGAYANGAEVLNVPTFFSISVTLIGIVTYLYYLFLERQNIQLYFLWLRAEVAKLWYEGKFSNPRPAQEGSGQPNVPNGRAGRSPYGSSESEQSEDDSQGTYQDDTGFVYHPRRTAAVVSPTQRLSDIAEGSEEQISEHVVAGSGPRASRRSSERQAQEDTNTDTDLSQTQRMSTVMLDRIITDSENEDIIRRREEGVMARNLGGVDVADPYYRHMDFETSTTRSDSYFGSQASIPTSELPGYYSSSQAPDDHSDYREDFDYESDHSQQYRYRHRLRPSVLVGEMTVEV